MALRLQDIEHFLAEVPEWQIVDDELERVFRFETFLQAIEFVQNVALIAEEEQHHPDIDIRYTSVKLRLTTHDAGGLTRKDFSLAKRVDGLFVK